MLRSDPLVGVNLQHLLQQVDSHRVGSLKHELKILGLHFRKRVDVVLGLEKLLYTQCNEDWSYLHTGDLLHRLLCWSPAEGKYPGELVNVCRAEFYLSVRTVKRTLTVSSWEECLPCQHLRHDAANRPEVHLNRNGLAQRSSRWRTYPSGCSASS